MRPWSTADPRAGAGSEILRVGSSDATNRDPGDHDTGPSAHGAEHVSGEGSTSILFEALRSRRSIGSRIPGHSERESCTTARRRGARTERRNRESSAAAGLRSWLRNWELVSRFLCDRRVHDTRAAPCIRTHQRSCRHPELRIVLSTNFSCACVTWLARAREPLNVLTARAHGWPLLGAVGGSAGRASIDVIDLYTTDAKNRPLRKIQVLGVDGPPLFSRAMNAVVMFPALGARSASRRPGPR